MLASAADNLTAADTSTPRKSVEVRGAALGPAQIDSLVWYAEALEADLRVKDIEWGAATDSLRIEIRFQVEQVEFWKSQARKWYDDPRLWFIVGGLSVLWAADISVD